MTVSPDEESTMMSQNMKELAVFDSVLRNDFGPENEVDFLVSFKENNTLGILEFVRIELELVELFARKVDLMSRTATEHSRNYIRRAAIPESARVVYAV